MAEDTVACLQRMSGAYGSDLAVQVESPLLQLHNKAVAAPLLWAPVMATCLCDYSHAVPESAFADLVQAMHLQSFADIPVQGELLWMFRYYQALAVAWPTALTSVKQSTHTAGSSLSTVDKQWKVCSVILTASRQC